ncbi:metallophosphoesterase [Janthinobacterium sp.]|uniref:metallophosphoesterase n=1 Tax=Janthinobacterium sp. TaxID=1871054 RepID=UPI0026206894|nr:metallophosphoesterase [Janthinobacterium sp.]
MRLLVLSDLHLEVWREAFPKLNTSASRPDVVVLAGDIHTNARAPGWAASAFPEIPVIYVSGNHEFYGGTLDQTNLAIRDACANFEHVHYLDCGQFVFNGVRFLGATLWTDFSLFGAENRSSAMVDANNVMNDYQRIRLASAGYRKLQPTDTTRLHAEHKAWLERKLDKPFAGPTVVVTHMAPSRRSVAPEYASDPVAAAFASCLDDLVSKANIWIHGHTHTSFDYLIGHCRVVANPLGYMKKGGNAENASFDANLIIELDGK